MASRVIYSPEATQHLRRLTARQRARVLDQVEKQLTHQATVVSRNRKKMEPNPIAEWELRIGEIRVY